MALVKIGSKIVHHARYVTFQLAEVAVPRRLYRAILDRIRRFAAIPPEGRADMTGCRRGQPNESGRGDAVTIDTSGTKRPFRHPECRFGLDPTSVVVPWGILKLEFPRGRGYIGSQESGAVAGKVIWEMSGKDNMGNLG